MMDRPSASSPRRKVEAKRDQREQDQRRAEPPDAAGFLRQGEQLEIVAEGFVVALHGFIDEEGADRIDGSLRMAEAIGVETARR